MKVIQTASALKKELLEVKSCGKSVGFVPTMGALHSGHLSLVEKAKQHTDVVVVSIFVNPTQFNDPKDFDKYPRTPDVDIQLLEEAGTHYLFLPESKNEVYPKEHVPTRIDLNPIDKVLEGEHRAGHFEGVVEVVDLLFNLVQPDKAFFGLKDFQQFLVIKRLAEKLHPSLQIVGVKTVREENLLARSSRNELLTTEQRALAAKLYETMSWVNEHFPQFSIQELESKAQNKLNVEGIKLEYFKVMDSENLEALPKDKMKHPHIFVAAFLGSVRLIDNLAINH